MAIIIAGSAAGFIVLLAVGPNRSGYRYVVLPIHSHISHIHIHRFLRSDGQQNYEYVLVHALHINFTIIIKSMALH